VAAVAAVVVNPAAAADPPEVVAVEWVAADAHQVVVAEAAKAVVDVPLVVAAADKVEEDKVAADARREAEAARVEVDKVVAVVVVPPVVAAVDKVEEAAVARVVVAADLLVVAGEWEVEAAVVDVPAVAGAAETVSSLSFGGASRACGAPLFC